MVMPTTASTVAVRVAPQTARHSQRRLGAIQLKAVSRKPNRYRTSEFVNGSKRFSDTSSGTPSYSAARLAHLRDAGVQLL